MACQANCPGFTIGRVGGWGSATTLEKMFGRRRSTPGPLPNGQPKRYEMPVTLYMMRDVLTPKRQRHLDGSEAIALTRRSWSMAGMIEKDGAAGAGGAPFEFQTFNPPRNRNPIWGLWGSLGCLPRLPHPKRFGGGRVSH